MISDLAQDFRYAARVLFKSPVYALVSIITLTLGIGASTAIFSVVYGVLLRPLPYPKPEQIVRVWEVDARNRPMQFANPNFEDMRAQASSLQGMAQMRSGEVPVTLAGQPDSVQVAYVSEDFFSILGIQPAMGRLFVPEERRFRVAPTALVSYAYWQRQLNATPNLESINFAVANEPTMVVGVLPPGFRFPDNSDVWLPREIETRLPSRSAHNWPVIARLRDGTSIDQAQADLAAIARRLSQQYRLEEKHMVSVALTPLKDALTSDVRPALLIVLGVAGLLLLVACANVMNLSLAQASARANELAVRVALGASRWRLVRQFLAEALLLSLLSGALGVLAAFFGVRLLLALIPADIPRLDEVSVNLPVLLFALGISFVVAVSISLFTALRATWRDVQGTLVEGGRRQGTGVRSRRTGRMIVAGQVAITLVLMTGAGLLGRSMLRVLAVDPGFETERVITLSLRAQDLSTRTEPQRLQFVEQLISRLRSLPGVQAAGGTNVLPLKASDSPDGTFVKINPQQLSQAQLNLIERSAGLSEKDPDPALLKDMSTFFQELFSDKTRTGNADYVVASDGYFETVGIPLRSGRLFNESDGPNAPRAALISESVAKQNWPNQDPIGQTIEFGNMDGDLRLLTIVGVIGDVRKHSLEIEPQPTVYVTYRQRQRSARQFDIVVRTNSEPTAMFGALRGALRDVDATVPARLQTFAEIFSESVNTRRFNLLLVGVFALTALLLAMAGVFGVLAYSVAQRTQEIGVRIALGATPGSILRMVLTQGLVTIGIGTVIGLAGSLLLTRTMRSLLFGVSPNDPLTVAGVALLLVLIAALASYIPARRATRVDPMVALRHE